MKGIDMLRLLAVAIVVLTLAGSALAYTCTTNTIWQNGRYTYCRTCCISAGHCYTDCF